MLELFPEGFEELDHDGGVELAAYTNAAGEERIWQAFGGAAVSDVQEDWADRWYREMSRSFLHAYLETAADAAFVTPHLLVGGDLDTRDSALAASQLEAAVVASQGRAAEAMRKLSSEARRAHVAESECGRLTVALDESDERAAEAIVRVAELEQDNVGLRSELETQTSWQQAHVRHA